MDNGWVKLHRQLFDSKLWLEESFSRGQAWVDLFANANHKAGSFWIRGNEVKLKRGQLGWSEITMTRRWSWSRNKVRRFLKWLEMEQQIIQQKDRYITTIITIINYDKFQSDDNVIQQTIQQKDSRRYINKNDKNVKNDKEDKKSLSITPASGGNQISSVIDLFKVINPSYRELFKRPPQRAAVDRLVKNHGLEQITKIINDILPKSNQMTYSPTITTPIQLEEKYAQLKSFLEKERSKELSKRNSYINLNEL